MPFEKGHKYLGHGKEPRDIMWNFRHFMSMVEFKRAYYQKHLKYIQKYREKNKEKINLKIHFKKLTRELKIINENFERNYDINTGNKLLNFEPGKAFKHLSQYTYLPINVLNFKKFMERIDQIKDFVT